jgi:hypothetical protein
MSGLTDGLQELIQSLEIEVHERERRVRSVQSFARAVIQACIN